MAGYAIRTYGDPVLRQRAPEIEEIDGRLKQLADDMLETMYNAPGVGLAAPQVGIQKRLFVYDVGDGEGPRTIVNPVLSEGSGEWTYEEGCLSVPGLSWPIVRPKEVHVTGYDLDGKDVDFEADEFLARVLQHEVDHLDGILLVERLDDDQRRDALRILRARALDLPTDDPDGLSGLAGRQAEGPGHGGRRL
ncbi:MAG: peptide deformylase [Acidobacteriota bacterium]|nr:peptide deformylase [Acidobacteriota bacterium]